MLGTMDALLSHDRVRAARAHIERSDETTLGRQAALSAIPAPTGAETARGARVAEMLEEAGLQDVKIDEVGNVCGWYIHGGGSVGAQHAAPLHDACVLLSAHLDTVFGPELDVSVARRGPRLEGPGIERIVHRALGCRRYRVTFLGPGGHSWAAFGVANPANAVGRAVAAIAKHATPDAPRTTHAVVRLGGGTSLNSIPQTAWFDVDLRSEDPRALERLDAAVRHALTESLDEENRQRLPGTAPLTVDVRRVGDRPSGLTPRAHPLVQTAVAATRAVGHAHQLACASTDANVPIALGVPAVALGAGGRAGDAH